MPDEVDVVEAYRGFWSAPSPVSHGPVSVRLPVRAGDQCSHRRGCSRTRRSRAHPMGMSSGVTGYSAFDRSTRVEVVSVSRVADASANARANSPADISPNNRDTSTDYLDSPDKRDI